MRTKSKPAIDLTEGLTHAKPPPQDKARRRQSEQWKVSERETAKWVRAHDGIDPQTAPIATSTGRCGDSTHLRYDTSSEHYKVEVKRDKAHWTTNLRKTWRQIVQISLDHPGYHAMLALYDSSEVEEAFMVRNGHRQRVPPMHCVTPERHAELLEAMQERNRMGDFLMQRPIYHSEYELWSKQLG